MFYNLVPCFGECMSHAASIDLTISSKLSRATGLLGRRVPALLTPEGMNPSQLILRKEYAWHLAGAMQPQEALEWVLVYHSSAHGLSYNTFLGKLA